MKTTSVRPMSCEFVSEGLLRIDNIGSGIGIIIFSHARKMAAGIHVLRGEARGLIVTNPAYYADTGIGYILEQFEKKGLRVGAGLSVAVAGGGGILSSAEKGSPGSKLTVAVKEILAKVRLPIKVEDTGGTKIRSMILNIDSGKIKIA